MKLTKRNNAEFMEGLTDGLKTKILDYEKHAKEQFKIASEGSGRSINLTELMSESGEINEAIRDERCTLSPENQETLKMLRMLDPFIIKLARAIVQIDQYTVKLHYKDRRGITNFYVKINEMD